MRTRPIVGIGKLMRNSGRAISINVGGGNIKEANVDGIKGSIINAIIVPNLTAPIVYVYDEKNNAYKIP